VRIALSSYICAMANRPCKPDADLKRLWQVLLPSTPFPACGAPETPGKTEKFDSAADHAAGGEPGDAEPTAAGARPSLTTIRPWRFF
jgi:hypothetical protein